MKTLLAALALLLTASPSEDPSPAERIDDPALAAAVTLLESESLKEHCCLGPDADYELASRLTGFLAAQVAGPADSPGGQLRAEALVRLERGVDTHLAMVLLAQAGASPLTRTAEAPTAGSDLDLADWYHWFRTGGADQPLTLPSPLPSPDRIGPDPLLLCREQIAAALRRSPEELEGTKEDYRESYRTVLLPNLERLEDFVDEAERVQLDLDGDGLDELLVRLLVPDGWDDAPATLLLRQSSPGAWELDWLELRRQPHLEVPVGGPLRVGDLDGDGLPEVIELSRHVSYRGFAVRIHGARGTWDRHVPSLDLVEHPTTRELLLVSREPYNLTGSANALEYVTCLGDEVTIERLGWLPEGTPRVLARLIVPR